MKKLHLLLISLFLILLMSCENFMNGSDIQEQLDEMIEVANAKSYTLVVSQESTMGSFLSAGDKTCKLGQTIDVQFTVKKEDYIYKGLKAVSKSNPNVSLADCVEFKVLSKDESNGIYKTQIKLLKGSDDILIIPDCTLVPAVISNECKPDSNAVSEQDSTISIAFNKPVKVEDFLDISINDASGQNLSDYFGEPYFSADSTSLMIPVNGKKHLIAINEPETTTKEVIVKLNLASITDLEGNPGNGTVTHKYRVNNKRDDIIPVLSAVSLYSSADIEDPNYKEITSKKFDEWSADGDGFGDFGKNHIADSVYVELEASDEGSGIAGFVIKEKLYKNVNGSTGDSTVTAYHVEAKPVELENHYSATYKLNNINDGILELEIFAEDNATNLSEKSIKYYVVKDTKIDSGYVKFKEEIGSFPDTSEGWKAAIPIIKGDTQDISITLSENAKDNWYSDSNIKCTSDYDIQAFWGYSDDEITSPVERNGNVFSFTRDVKKLVYIKLICKDAIGNEKEIIKRMDPRPELVINDQPGMSGQFTIANKEMLFIKSNFTQYLSQEGSMMDFTKVCTFTYRFHDNQDNPSEITINSDSDMMMYDVRFNIPKAWEKLNKGYDYTGPVDIFVNTKLGDFPSPLSVNYVTYTISNWIHEWDVSVDFEPQEPVLSSGSDRNYEVIEELGPEEKPYLKENIKLKVQKKTGCYMVTISDYMTEAGKSDKLKYTFYAVPYEFKELPEEELQWMTDDDKNRGAVSAMNSIKSTSPELFLPSNTKYLIYITVSDDENLYAPYNNPIIKELYDLDRREKPGFKFYLNDEKELRNELNLEKDLTAPYFNMEPNFNQKTQMFESAGGYTVPIPTDIANFTLTGMYEDSLYKNKAGNYEFTYYLLPNTADSINQIPAYTVKELESKYASFAKTYEFNISVDSPGYNYKLSIPYGNIPEGLYTISFVLKDKYNNAAAYTYPVLNKSLGKLPYTKTFGYNTEEVSGNPNEFWYDFVISDDDPAHPEIKIENGKSSINANLYYIYDFNSVCSWVQAYDLCHETDSESPANFEKRYNLGHNAIIMNGGQWVKLNAYYGFDNSDSLIGKGFYDTEYFFLTYDLSSTYGSNHFGGLDYSWFKCELKNCFDGLNGVQIFADNSVLVHTMYSSEKLTETRLDKDAAAIWEKRGLETGLKVYYTEQPVLQANTEELPNPDDPESLIEIITGYSIEASKDKINVNYDLSNLDAIPSGYWYTTIVRFVDGTVLMTDIKQKQ